MSQEIIAIIQSFLWSERGGWLNDKVEYAESGTEHLDVKKRGGYFYSQPQGSQC